MNPASASTPTLPPTGTPIDDLGNSSSPVMRTTASGAKNCCTSFRSAPNTTSRSHNNRYGPQSSPQELSEAQPDADLPSLQLIFNNGSSSGGNNHSKSVTLHLAPSQNEKADNKLPPRHHHRYPPAEEHLGSQHSSDQRWTVAPSDRSLVTSPQALSSLITTAISQHSPSLMQEDDALEERKENALREGPQQTEGGVEPHTPVRQQPSTDSSCHFLSRTPSPAAYSQVRTPDVTNQLDKTPDRRGQPLPGVSAAMRALPDLLPRTWFSRSLKAAERSLDYGDEDTLERSGMPQLFDVSPYHYPQDRKSAGSLRQSSAKVSRGLQNDHTRNSTPGRYSTRAYRSASPSLLNLTNDILLTPPSLPPLEKGGTKEEERPQSVTATTPLHPPRKWYFRNVMTRRPPSPTLLPTPLSATNVNINSSVTSSPIRDDVQHSAGERAAVAHPSTSPLLDNSNSQVTPPSCRPPPPWTPDEALFWMRGQLTLQEQVEMKDYQQVYYCGPAVPPRTACGMTSESSTTEVGTGGAVLNHVPSYFPVMVGMHIAFRYEVVEVLGFGNFSVVVKAYDHAAHPFSSEWICALKIVRREEAYRKAAEAELDVCVKMAEAVQRGIAGSISLDDGGGMSPISTALTALSYASVSLPHDHFDFRGHLVLVFPLLGMSLRDVLELRRNSATERFDEEPSLRQSLDTQLADIDAGEDGTSAGERTASLLHGFPLPIQQSLTAQVIRSMVFLHCEAGVLHGDIKLENILFTGRRGGFCDMLQRQCSSQGEVEGGERTSTFDPSSFQLPSIPYAPHPPSSWSTTTTITVTQPPGVPMEDSASLSPICGCPSISPAISHSSFTASSGPECLSPPPQHLVKTPSIRELRRRESRAHHYGLSDVPHHNYQQQQCRSPSRALNCSTSAMAASSIPPSPPSVRRSMHTPPSAGVSHTGIQSKPPHVYSASVSTAAVTSSTRGCDGNSPAWSSSQSLSLPLQPRESDGQRRSSISTINASSTSQVVLIDFGHAKTFKRGVPCAIFPLQSPSYRCPEMALRLPYTEAIDMWSIGCVLYEVMSGHTLFLSAEDDFTLLDNAVHLLGMPDETFLATIKSCWKQYKGLQQQQKETEKMLSDEDADATKQIETCWKQFISLLNQTAIRRRKQREELEESCIVSPTGEVGPASIAWENADQLQFLTHLFPMAVVVSDKKLIAVSEDLVEYMDVCSGRQNCRSAAQQGKPTTQSTKAQLEDHISSIAEDVEVSSSGGVSASHYLSRADFLLGCLYWNPVERLTAEEATYHPFLSHCFSTAPSDTLSASTFTNENRSSKQGTSGGGSTTRAHASGYFYLQQHPLTSSLFRGITRLSSGKTVFSSEGRDTSVALPNRRPASSRPRNWWLHPSAIQSYQLPCCGIMAPSVFLWEHHGQMAHRERLSFACYDESDMFSTSPRLIYTEEKEIHEGEEAISSVCEGKTDVVVLRLD